MLIDDAQLFNDRLQEWLKARGWSLREAGPQVDCAFQTVARIAGRGSRRPVRLDGWAPCPGRLTLADREEITGQTAFRLPGPMLVVRSPSRRSVRRGGETEVRGAGSCRYQLVLTDEAEVRDAA